MIDNQYKLDKADIFIIILSFIYMLRNLPLMATRMSSTLYAGIIVMLFVFSYFRLSKNKNVVLYLLPLLAIYLLNSIIYDLKNVSDTNSIMRWISGVLQTMILPILSADAIVRKRVKLAFMLLIVFLSIETLTYVTSIFAEMSLPGIIRMNPGQLIENDAYMYAMKTSLNVGNFDTVYGASALIPILVMVIKWRSDLIKNRFLRMLPILLLMLILYFIYMSQFTTALVCSLLMISTLLLPSKMSMPLFRRSLFAIFVVAVLARSFIPVILHMVADNIESPIMSERFEGIAITLEGGTDTGSEDIDERTNVYTRALTTIFEDPIVGEWGGEGHSGHSFILDTIAKYGLLGILLILVFYKNLLKLFYYPYKELTWVYSYLYGLLGVSIFYILNPSPLLPQMLFCYPLSAFIINSQLQKQ